MSISQRVFKFGNTFFIFEFVILMILTFLSLWEVSLIKTKKWRYTRLSRRKGYTFKHSLEEIVLLLRNMKIFTLILGMFLFFLEKKPLRYEIKGIIIFVVYIFVFILIPYVVTEKGASKIISFLFPIEKVVYPLFSPVFFPGEKGAGKEETVDEKISSFIFEGKEKGIITIEDEDMVERLLYFKEKSAREIMTPRISIISIEENRTIGELKELISQKKKSRIPVYKEKIDNIVGIINAKDVFEYWGKDEQKISEAKGLLREPYFITEYMKIIHLLKTFQEKKIKLALVVDEYGGLSGLVTIEDIVEEIVGEIYDEFEKEKKLVEKKEDYWIIDGETPLEEVEEELEIEFDETYSAVTIGGLLNFITGKFPKPGEKIEIKGYLFEVSSVTDKGIKKITVKKLKEKKENEDEI